MFKMHTMKKVHIFLLNENLKSISNILYDLKLIEFFEKEEKHFEKFESEKLPKEADELLKIRSTITLLKKYYKEEEATYTKEDVPEVALNLYEEISKTEKEINFLNDELKRQEILAKLKITKEQIKKDDITIGFISSDAQIKLDLLKEKNLKIKTYNDSKNNRLYFYTNTNSKNIPFQFKEFYLPLEIDVSLVSKLKIKEQEKIKLIETITKLANSNLHNLQQQELNLSKNISIYEAKNKFKKTENFVILSGYVPEKDVKKLKKEIEKEIGDKYDLIEEEADENAPIKLQNGKISGNFENLLRMYSFPKYKEIDPTFFLLFAFPIFYGFILGDFGYGIISLIIFTMAKKKYSEFKEFLAILQLSSISSIIFGLLYGEFFGFEPYHLFPRSQMPEELLLASLIFGLIHLNIAFITGFFNEYKTKLSYAINNNLSWIVFQVALLLIALGINLSLDFLRYLGFFFIFITAVMLYKAHGFMGVADIPSFFTNVLSYARLMAVGLSSVVIAILVNQFTLTFFEKGTFGLILGIIIFSVGHVINIVLGNFESFLQALRLNYVEFFSKFYKGDGREFEPFGSRLHNEMLDE